MKRVIHIFGKMDIGGAETRTMEIYRGIDRQKIQFDFLTMKEGMGYYDSEIESLGGQIFPISSPSKVSVIKHLKEIIQVLEKEGPFYAVHVHTAFHAGVVCLAAKIAGVKIRIVHSRSASDPNTKGFRRKVYFILMRILITLFSTKMVACGKDAGYFLYGKSNMKKVKVIKNAINIAPFRNLNFRNPKLRSQLGINENALIIGHVGSFSPVKNHDFLIEIGKELKRENLNFKMVFVGDGKQKSKIEKEVVKQNLSNQILFLGLRSDIPDLMSMFDILLLPSFYEGIPGVIVEAQAAGTPCILSDSVTKEVDVGSGLVEFISINNTKQWCESILTKGEKKVISASEVFNKLVDEGFTLETSINEFYKLYNIKR